MNQQVKGAINAVWCARCGKERRLVNQNIGAARREAFRKGWRIAPGEGWVCPDHDEKRSS